MSPAKKAAVKARLKRVRPKNPGGGGKAKPKGKALTASNPGTTAATKNNNNRKPRGGATYQAVKVTGQAAMPLTDYVLGAGPKSADGLIAHVRERATFELGKGYAVAGVDFAASKHRLVRHANALSRLSVTALAPEAYLALKTFEDAQAKVTPQNMHAELAVATTGYNPRGKGWSWANHPRFQMYQKLKWGGALVRAIANRTRFGRALTKPIRENILSELGGSV